MKKKKIAIISIITCAIVITIISIKLIIDKNNQSFNIISVTNLNKEYTIKFKNVKNAKYYKIIVYDENDSPVYVENTTDNYLNKYFDFLNYGQKYLITVFAYDNKDNSIAVDNPYEFSYNEPTFSPENNLLFKNGEDYTLLINGDIKVKDYYVSVNDGDYTIKKEKLTENTFIISKDLFTGLEEVLTVKLFDGTHEISKLDLYSNISPIKDIKILAPEDNTELEHKDINLKFEGGENATKFTLQIFNNNKIIKEIGISKKELIISKDFFKKSEKYTLRIIGTYKDYKNYIKSSEVSFTISSKEPLNAPYTSSIVANDGFIEIINPNSSGKIYYTVDGSDPIELGIEYTDKISIKEDTLIKAVIKDKNNNSEISTFNISSSKKDKYNIYISSYALSNQEGMNELAKYIKEKLEKHNINVYLSGISDSISSRINKTSELDLDLYLGLYANNTGEQETYGIETWTNKEADNSYSLANLFQNNIINVYYDKKANHGLKYSNGSIDELNKVKSKLNVRVVLGNLDNEKDGNWFDIKYEEIGDSISETILKYFAII